MRVVVVGGGVLGTMHAWRALDSGHDVVHLEREPEARGASVRNFGLVWVSGRAPGEDLSLALRARRSWQHLAEKVPGLGFRANGSLTALENVCTGALGGLRGPRLGLVSYPRSVRHDAMDQLERVGLTEQALQRADTLSGEQRQRVAVARALLQRPDVLLADEPVASLDPDSSEQVMGLLSEISRRDGLTVVCSLHQLDLAMSWGERVVGLRAGGVVLDTPVDGLSRESAMAVYSGGSTADSRLTAVG